MKKSLKKIVSCVLTVSMLFAFTGCGGSDSSGGGSTSSSSIQTATGDAVAEISEDADGTVKSEMHIAFDAQPPTLDQHTSSASATRQIGRGGIFEMLVTSDENYGYVCELADSVDINDDYTEFVFHLREGIKFHNGKEMTADDVVASMNRWKDYYGSATAACGDSEFVKVDDYTVSITLESSYMNFLEMIAGSKQPAAIMPAEIIEAAGDGTVDEFIGTGPYMVEEWAQDQYIKLVKFEDYQPYGTKGDASGWGGYKEALVDTVYIDFVTDASTRVSGIQTGEYDIAVNLPSDNYDMLNSNEDLVTIPDFSGGLSAVFDKSEGWSADPAFRKAVNAALNKEEIAIAALGLSDFFRLDSGYMFVEQTKWYSDAGSDSYETYDIDLAKQYLEECGYDGSEITVLCSSEYPVCNNTGIAIEQQLEEAGINVNLLVVDWPTQQEYVKQADKYDIFITWFTPCSAPTDILYLQSTWEGWSDDATLQDYLTQIAASTDETEAYELWNECQAYCWDEYLPIIKIADMYNYSVVTDQVAGLKYFQGPIYWNTVVYE